MGGGEKGRGYVALLSICSISSIETDKEITLYLRVLSSSVQIAGRCALRTLSSNSNDLLL